MENKEKESDPSGKRNHFTQPICVTDKQNSGTLEVDSDKKLQEWKEAGKALKKALCQLTDISVSENSSSRFSGGENTIDYSLPSLTQDDLSAGSETISINNQSCTVNENSQTDWPAKMMKDSDKGNSDVNSTNTEVRLARSMEQSFAWRNEVDPMNQMWEEYESSWTQVHQSVSSSEAEDNSATCISKVSDKNMKDSQTVAGSDPSLTELRQRMRRLVSLLSVSASQTSRVPPGSLISQRSICSGTVSAGELSTHRSPKINRRRHHRRSKSSLVLSDDETDVCTKNVPPKLFKEVQNVRDVKVKSSHRKARRNKCNNKKMCAASPGNAACDVRVYNLDNKHVENSCGDHYDLCHNSDAAQKRNSENECITSGEKSQESESGCTDVDKQLYEPGLERTESVANFGDVESCESEKEKQPLLKENGNHAQQLLQANEHMMEKKCGNFVQNMLQSGISSPSDSDLSVGEDRDSFYSCSNVKQAASDEDSDGLGSFDLPDAVQLSDSVSESELDLTLNYSDMKYLQDINVSNSSSDAEAGVDADDEFECDCYLCQWPRDTEIENSTDVTQNNSEQHDSQYVDELTDLFQRHDSDLEDQRDETDDINTAVSPLGLLMSDSYGSDVLDLMFTNVIMHMLSVYPDLLTEQTPPPVPDIVFKGFTVIKVTQSYVDNELACPICLCKFEIDEELKELPCSHYFHPLCIQAWIQKAGTCPVCRHNLTQPVKEANSQDATEIV